MAGILKTIDDRVHFIGIGGIGMSGIARLFLHRGASVSGSDVRETAATRELGRSGAKIFIGHDSSYVHGASIIVYSSAIRPDNPELKEAESRGIPLVKRAQALSYLMRDKNVITISGSHGKTTTTSLVSFMLIEAGLEPTVAIGGILKNIGANAMPGKGEFFVAEADESDGSFLFYNPQYSIVTNIDREHLDYYGTFEKELEAFSDFLGRTRGDGCVIAYGDDANLRHILAGSRNKRVFFGMDRANDIYAQKLVFSGLNSEFDCYYKGSFIGRFDLALGGAHNVCNALGSIALGMELGIGLATIRKILSGYKGAGRRLEVKFQENGIVLLDDYAHHPSEIRATLAAVKFIDHARLIAVFQPHRYSRTKLLLDEFADAFEDADKIIITDIYAAGESPLEGINAEVVFNRIKQRWKEKEAWYLPRDRISSHVLGMIKPRDLVMTLGAGDITKVSDELAQEFKRKSSGK